MVHSWFFPILDAPALGRLRRRPECCVTLIDLHNPFSRGLLLLYRFNLKSLLSWGITLAFPFLYCWSSSILLYLSTRSISWHKLVTGLSVRDFLKPCSDGRPTLKVLTTTSSKSPSISLNISQYLSAYAFTDSPSLIDIDNKEFRGWGTLLHVMNHHLAHALHDLFSENRFHLCGAFASCLPSSCPDPFHAQDWGVHLVGGFRMVRTSLVWSWSCHDHYTPLKY